MKKIVILLLIISILLISGCGQKIEPAMDEVMEEPVEKVVEPEVMEETREPKEPVEAMEPKESLESMESKEPERKVVEIAVDSYQYGWTPNPIRVPYGHDVILKVRSLDVDHGIAIPEYGISERLPAGKEIEIAFLADKKGRFPFFCSVFCGSGHSGMTGQLIVE